MKQKIKRGSAASLRLVPNLHRAAHRVATYLDHDTTFAVSQAEAHVLTHLTSFGESTVAALHEAFGHRRSTLTSILDRLEERGFVTRQTSAADRRTFLVALTPPGRRAAEGTLQLLRTLEDDVRAAVSATDIRGFLKVADAIAGYAPTRIVTKAPRRGRGHAGRIDR